MASRGRPREFDRELALRKAMNVFWALGYEGASLAKLMQAMANINAPSFYAAFGSKELLFREAVELYQRTEGSGTARALREQPTAKAAIEAMLRDAVGLFTDPNTPPGCLVVLGAVTGSRESAKIQGHLMSIRLKTPELLQRRLKRGIAEGDVPRGFDTKRAAAFYVTVLHGLSIQARDEVPKKTLMQVVDVAMEAWEQFKERRTN